MNFDQLYFMVENWSNLYDLAAGGNGVVEEGGGGVENLQNKTVFGVYGHGDFMSMNACGSGSGGGCGGGGGGDTHIWDGEYPTGTNRPNHATKGNLSCEVPENKCLVIIGIPGRSVAAYGNSCRIATDQLVNFDGPISCLINVCRCWGDKMSMAGKGIQQVYNEIWQDVEQNANWVRRCGGVDSHIIIKALDVIINLFSFVDGVRPEDYHTDAWTEARRLTALDELYEKNQEDYYDNIRALALLQTANVYKHGKNYSFLFSPENFDEAEDQDRGGSWGYIKYPSNRGTALDAEIHPNKKKEHCPIWRQREYWGGLCSDWEDGIDIFCVGDERRDWVSLDIGGLFKQCDRLTNSTSGGGSSSGSGSGGGVSAIIAPICLPSFWDTCSESGNLYWIGPPISPASTHLQAWDDLYKLHIRDADGRMFPFRAMTRTRFNAVSETQRRARDELAASHSDSDSGSGRGVSSGGALKGMALDHSVQSGSGDGGGMQSGLIRKIMLKRFQKLLIKDIMLKQNDYEENVIAVYQKLFETFPFSIIQFNKTTKKFRSADGINPANLLNNFFYLWKILVSWYLIGIIREQRHFSNVLGNTSGTSTAVMKPGGKTHKKILKTHRDRYSAVPESWTTGVSSRGGVRSHTKSSFKTLCSTHNIPRKLRKKLWTLYKKKYGYRKHRFY